MPTTRTTPSYGSWKTVCADPENSGKHLGRGFFLRCPEAPSMKEDAIVTDTQSISNQEPQQYCTSTNVPDPTHRPGQPRSSGRKVETLAAYARWTLRMVSQVRQCCDAVGLSPDLHVLSAIASILGVDQGILVAGQAMFQGVVIALNAYERIAPLLVRKFSEARRAIDQGRS